MMPFYYCGCFAEWKGLHVLGREWVIWHSLNLQDYYEALEGKKENCSVGKGSKLT